MPDTSPPNFATSHTRLDERNEYWGLVEMKKVSIPERLLVHLRHLQLVVEVGDRPQALHDRLRAVVRGEVDDEALERLDAHVVEVADGLGQHLLALLEVEARLGLLRVAGDRHDDVVEMARRCAR